MRPVYLSLTNFKSYKSLTFNFPREGVAGIFGPNGSGKSLLAVDAITFALYGQGRDPNLADYIRDGETSCEVEYIFEARGAYWRVIREVNASGKNRLQFDRQLEDEQWVPAGGDTTRETQAAIIEVIGLDYNGLVSTAIVPQGEADRFTKDMKPAERKELFYGLLNLDRYEVLRQEARRRLGEANGAVDGWSTRLPALEEKIANGPRLEQERKIEEKALANDETALRLKRQERDEIVAELARVETLAQKRQGIQQQWKAASERRSRAERQREDTRAALADIKALLQDTDKIQNAAKEHEALTRAIEQATAELDKVMGYLYRYSEIEMAVKERENEHRRRVKELQDRVDRLQEEARLAERSGCDSPTGGAECVFLARAREALEKLPSVLGALDQAREEEPGPTEQEARELEKLRPWVEKADVAADRQRIADMKARRDELAPMALKAKDLPALEERKKAREQELDAISEAIQQADEEVRRLKAELEECEVPDVAALQGKKATLEAEIKRIETTIAERQQRIGEIKAQIAGLDEARAELESLRREIATMKRRAVALEALSTAWSKSGVPALLIENRTLEVQEHANEYLRRTTGGKIQLNVVTQTDTGRETFDIYVYYRGKERKYSSLSGAERRHVDLAFREGISTLLAGRSKADVRLRVLDEAFADLDTEAAAEVAKSLPNMARPGELLLVISHWDKTLEEYLPVRFYTSKDENEESHVKAVGM